jgi:hypothetical protein
MNFKFGRFFYLGTGFLIGIFFLLLGFFTVALPWSSLLQKVTVEWINGKTLLFFLFGLAFALIGASIILYAFFNSKRRYVCVEMGSNRLSIDENAIHQFLDIYWQENFPTTEIPYTLGIKKNAIQIVAHLPSMPLAEQKICVEKMKMDINELFQTTLGYNRPVFLAVSFDGNEEDQSQMANKKQ